MNKQQIANLIGAGTMTAIILAIVMLLSGAAQPNETSQAAPVTGASAETITTDTLQTENVQLQQTVDTLLQREAEYAAQIELANQLLAEQNQPAAGQAEAATENEHEEHEDHEEYEGAEHEEADHE